MTTIIVTYPREDGASFDFDYYEGTHMPLVAKRWGGAHAAEILADIPNFTNVRPIVQINEEIGNG